MQALRAEHIRQVGFSVNNSELEVREQTPITFSTIEKKVPVDLTKSSPDQELMQGICEGPGLLQEADLEFRPGESLNLHLFIDRSVLEVF
ncbi:MAG: GH32 C-terminal domain-containing protein [Bacteroidales bacterium]